MEAYEREQKGLSALLEDLAARIELDNEEEDERKEDQVKGHQSNSERQQEGKIKFDQELEKVLEKENDLLECR